MASSERNRMMAAPEVQMKGVWHCSSHHLKQRRAAGAWHMKGAGHNLVKMHYPG